MLNLVYLDSNTYIFIIAKAESSKFRTHIMRHGQAVYRTEAEKPSSLALSVHRLGASGGELLVPPRSSARMRLKEALTAACSRRRAALLKNPPGALLRQRSDVSAIFYCSIQDTFRISLQTRLCLCFHSVKT